MTDIMQFFEERFIPEPNSGCWLWTSTWTPDGYGVARRVHSGPTIRGHRLAWEMFRGPIPDHLQVCHRCDVRCCVNPDHLFLATFVENIADRDRKGRNARLAGEANGSAILTEDLVRQLRADPRRQIDLAVAYGISQTQVSAIKRREAWPHVG